MGFNRRKMEDKRRRAAEKKAAEQRATDPQIMEDAERLVAVWNERQKQQMPMLLSPTIGAAIAAAIGFSGCAAQRAGPSAPSTCARSIVTTTRQSRVSFRRCRAAHAGPMRRLPSSSSCRAKASPTKCGRNISGACWESRMGWTSRNRPLLGGRRWVFAKARPSYGWR